MCGRESGDADGKKPPPVTFLQKMFLGNEEKVYILDKSEGNQAQVNGHPAWGAVWDIASNQATVMDIATNTYCATGMHLPNGSYATFGGNSAVGPDMAEGDVVDPSTAQPVNDTTYQDADGRKSIRILNPCKGDSDQFGSDCLWFDDPNLLSMQATRWYAAAEPLGDGSIALIGGFANGGYVNRMWPNEDPTFEGGESVPTYEFFPSKGPAQVMSFLSFTSGLNAYAHTYLMASGKMLVQANYSTSKCTMIAVWMVTDESLLLHGCVLACALQCYGIRSRIPKNTCLICLERSSESTLGLEQWPCSL